VNSATQAEGATFGGRFTPSRPELLLRASRHRLAQVVDAGLPTATSGTFAERIGGRLLVLASGGADSTALLVLLAGLAARDSDPSQALSVLSIDHGLRPEASAEAACAVEAARHCGVLDVRVRRVEVASGGNLLERAREARRAAAAEVAGEIGATSIALGHHADDLAESILLSLARGGGVDALRALRPCRDIRLGNGAPMRLLRPLLGARRAELRALLEELGVPWRDDPSNALRMRGAMRSSPEIAGLLDRIAAGAVDLLDEVEGLCAFRDVAAGPLVPTGSRSIARDEVERLPTALQREVLLRLARGAGGELPRRILRAAVARRPRLDREPARFTLSSELELAIDAARVAVVAREAPRPIPAD